MAVKVAIGSGNFTTAGTWGVVDATSYLNAQNATESLLTTAYSGTRSQGFTPGAITISHIGVKLCERIGTTGTMDVHLALQATHVEVAGTLVTINVSDLPSCLEADNNGGWILLKLATPVLLLAATAYEIEARTSNATQVDLWCDGTVDNLSRILVTTTTGAPGAGDDLIISKEYTGAGTGNAITVTMDNTATTDFGSAPTAANSLVSPGLEITNGGTLICGTTAATNYYLKMSNSILVKSGGTFNYGTTGTPIPRDSTAVLEFDPGADDDYGLTICNLGNFNAQGLSRTSGKNVVVTTLNTDEATNSTSLGVTDDTGWLDNDIIGVASTTRTASQSEKGTLNGNAGASSLTVDGFAGAGGGLAAAHSGTSPTQAEVVLLTRNVKIRSATSTLRSYVTCNNTSVTDLDWVEFRYVLVTANINASGTFTMNYCSVYDTETGALSHSSGTGVGVFGDCVFFGCGTASSTQVTLSGNYTVTNMYVVGGGSTGPSSTVFASSAGSASITNLVIAGSTTQAVAGGTGTAFRISMGSATTAPTVNGVIVHSVSCAGMGILGDGGTGIVADGQNKSISNITIWRTNESCGLQIGDVSTSKIRNVYVDGLTLFGCTTSSIKFTNTNGIALFQQVKLNDVTSNGDTTFSTTNGMEFGNTGQTAPTVLLFDDIFVNTGNFSTASGIKTAHTNDINLVFDNNESQILKVYLNNVTLAASTEINGTLANKIPRPGYDFISQMKHDQTAGNHKSLYRVGNITKEVTTVHTGSHATKMTPSSATVKLVSNSFFIAVASGATLTPSVYVYEDGSYNGARARLILKRNDAIGITSDTVIDTATAASDAAWEELTGTTASASDDGVMEFVIDCDGTAGNLFYDSFTV